MPYSPAQIMLLAIWNGYLEHPGYKLATFCLKTWTLWNWRFSDGWMFSLKSDLIFGTFISLNLATALRNNRNGDHHQLVRGPSTWRCACVCACLFVFCICACVCVCICLFCLLYLFMFVFVFWDPHPNAGFPIQTRCSCQLTLASSSASAPAVDWEDHRVGPETFLATSLATSLVSIQYWFNLHKWSW